MKKRLALLSMIGILFLASCQSKTDTTKRGDNPSTENKNALKLDIVSNGKELKTRTDDQKDYVTVKIAESYKDTLFYVTTSLTDELKAHGSLTKSVSIAPLTFTTDISDAEKSALTGYVYNETGLYAKDFGFDISKDITSWITTINLEEISKNYKENDKYSISVIYVPSVVTHYATSYTALECYVMFPLYYQIYKDGEIQDTFNSKAVDLTNKLEFENNRLKSETTSVSA